MMTLPEGPEISVARLFEIFITNPFPFLRECYETYGDLFTLKLGTFDVDRHGASGAWVFLCSAEHLKTLFRADAGSVLGGAANEIQFQQLFPPEVSTMMDGPEHIERRRIVSNLVQGEKKIRAFTDNMHRLVADEVSRFPSRDVFALAPCLRRVSSRVMRQMTLGASADDDGIEARVREFGNPGISREDKGKLVSECAGMLKRKVERQRACPHSATDGEDGEGNVLSVLMREQERGALLSDTQISWELLNLLIGGSDTTSSSMSWAMAWILSNDAVLARLQEEIDRVLGNRPPRGEDIDRLDYLDAAIKEACRISPLLFNSSARLLTQPLALGDHGLPAGTIAASCVHVIHTRPDYYPNPLEFDPERFLGVKPDPNRWVPFGGGIRRCLGMAFALYEMKVVIASLLQLARLEPVDVRTTTELQGSFFGPAGGVQVRRRDEA